MRKTETTHGRMSSRLPMRRGSTVIIVMIFLVLFATLAVAFAAATNMNLQQAGSSNRTLAARFSAESGLEYTLLLLDQMRITPAEAHADLLEAVQVRLAGQLNGQPVIGGQSISYDGDVITIPPITDPQGHQSYRISIGRGDGDTLWIRTFGSYQDVSRGIVVTVRPKNVISIIFDYGVASKGQIRIGGDGTLVGLNSFSEANILSATYSNLEAVAISGNSTLSGDIHTSNPDSYVSITGSPTLAGTTDRSEFINHIHIGVGDPEFPELDTSIYTQFVTNTLSGPKNIKEDMVLENITIPPGMNPTFNSNVVIRGVLHIQSPNQVKFNGNAVIQGVIVTDDAGGNAYTSNTLTFNGSAESQGVESLPNEPQFAGLRQMPGTMILAPGFGVNFSGSFTTLNGAIAAEQIEITGNAGGVIRGPIICYGDTEFKLWGSSHVTLDRSYYTGTPPGFINPYRLVIKPETYTEVLAQ